MALTDPIADMLTRIRNASAVQKKTVVMPFSKMKLAVLNTFYEGGFIHKVEEFTNERNLRFLKVNLKYTDRQVPVIHSLEILSKPSRRIYSPYGDIPRIRNGFGMVVISTSKGIISDRTARAIKAGGELICSIA